MIKKTWIEFIEKYKEYFLSNYEMWFYSLGQVENYIIKNNKRPSSTDKDIRVKQLGSWVCHQLKNYSKNEQIMRDETIKKVWVEFIEKYKEYFLSNNEIWFHILKQVEDYILKNNKRPSHHDKDIEIKKLGNWICSQQSSFFKNKNIMKDELIREHWIDFTIKYKQYFLSNTETWFYTLKQVEDYILKNNKRPSSSENDIRVKQLGKWIKTQKTNYSKNENIMRDEIIKNAWEDFTKKYEEYFLSNNEMWFNSLKQVEDYILKNNKTPLSTDKDIQIKKLCTWIDTQKINYSKNENIMKDEIIKKEWVDFIEKYKQHFLSNNEIWFHSLKQVEDYIIKNNKRPSSTDKDIEIKKLGLWVRTQKTNYSKNKNIMKDETIKKQWIDFTIRYKEYF